jgi:hypothetical protein
LGTAYRLKERVQGAVLAATGVAREQDAMVYLAVGVLVLER